MADPRRQDDCFEAGPWRITARKSHILKSVCERKLEEGCPRDSPQRCSVCRFNQDLDLPLPEMVFPESFLRLEHVSGAVLEFQALEALKLVNNNEEPIKIAAAEEWGKLRPEGMQEVKEKVKPFDWTYTTSYKGTLSSVASPTMEVSETSERIDYDQLKLQEKIAFYTEVILFEDELADNGAAMLSVKIRVMASGFFILQRFFLRVDGVLVRLIETRYHHCAGSEFILREYTRKESTAEELKVPTSILTDPNRLGEVLPVKEQALHKLTLPTSNLS